MKKSKFGSISVSILIGSVAAFGITSCSILGAGCSGMMGHGGHAGHSGYSSHSENNTESDASENIEIVREGEIDVYNIDVNMDGYVYQDQMHWNVMSDKPAQCPICGMELKKVSVTKAKENLKSNGFKVK